MSMKGKVV